MFAPLSLRLFQSLALTCGMALVVGAYAAEGHDHGEPAKAEPGASRSAGEPDIRPNLKALAKKNERRAESPEPPTREASKEPAADSAKEPGKAPSKSAAKAPGKGTTVDPTDPKSGVSMSDLRDLIDQKVAEVRARQAAAPVVQIRAKPSKPKSPVQPAMFTPGREGSIPTPHGAPRVSSAGGRGGVHERLNPNGHDVHWAYSGDTGPESWGMLKPEFQQCMLGKRQSPIDIRDGLPVQLDPIAFDYRPSGFRVIDNGHTIQANVDPGNSITLQGRRYELVQFHFHRPSEERVNGKQFDMVAHLVHKDAEGKLAVIAVLIEQGNAHPALQLVWNALPLEKGTEQISSVPIDLNSILPERKTYFTYMGSLTTPPCTEGVLWMVMKQPAQMSRDQINIFARMYPMNARPVQSAQGRMIKDGQ